MYQPDIVSWTRDNVNITYTFPAFSDSLEIKRLCRALLFVQPAEPLILDIPCDLRIPDAFFVCERQTKNPSIPLRNRTVTAAVCPREWVAVDGDCYTLYKLNLTAGVVEDKLCQNGEIVSYGNRTQFRPLRSEIQYSQPNHIVTFLALWLENKKSRVVLLNGVLEKPASWQKYIVVRLPQLSENIAASPLSILTRMSINLTSFQRISSQASHVFCRTSHNQANNSCETKQYTCGDGTCILDIYQCDGIFHCQDGSDENACRPFCHAKQGNDMNVTNSICPELCKAPSCVCDGMYFQCRNGGCVRWSRVCDCKRDCQDGSDEQSCSLCYHGGDLNYPSEKEAKCAIRPKKQGTLVCGDREIIPTTVMEHTMMRYCTTCTSRQGNAILQDVQVDTQPVWMGLESAFL